MSLEISNILIGHKDVSDISNIFSVSANAADVFVRNTHTTDYKIVEVVLENGQRFVVNVFLNPYAIDDHIDIYNGPSTYLTVQYDPFLVPMMEAVASSFGGYMRLPSSAEWKRIPSQQRS